MSSEAKKLKIPRGTPLFKLKDLFERNNVEVFSSNYALYGDISRRIMSIIMDSTDKTEIYSIDEAFANWDFIDPVEEAYNLRLKIKQWTGMTVSIGLAQTKTLAKIANHIGKKNREGIYWIREEIREDILRDTAIEDVWGIGRQISLFLRSRNVFTAYDFIQLDDWWIKKHLSIVSLRTKWELEGRPSIEFETEVKENRAIMSSKSFGEPIKDLENLLEATKSYVHDAFNKMTRQNLKGKSITIYLTTNRFRNKDKQYSNSITIDLEDYSDYLPDFIKAADMGIKQIYKMGYLYKKTSVLLSDLKISKEITPDLFTLKDPRFKKIQTSVNEINKKYGNGTVTCNLNKSKNSKWFMKRELLSPKYTTSWKEIPKIN